MEKEPGVSHDARSTKVTQPGLQDTVAFIALGTSIASMKKERKVLRLIVFTRLLYIFPTSFEGDEFRIVEKTQYDL